MARLYKDGAGLTYDDANGKFISVNFGEFWNSTTSTLDAITPYTPFDYGTTTAFEQKVDNSLAGNMRDCGECHVGGGGMEYMPRNASGGTLVEADRVPFRTATLTGVTAFNHFIDIFDEDGDGIRSEAKLQDFAQTGVLEMDCLMCHLEGYSWQNRKDAVRVGKFDASRVTGAGLGTAIDGLTVTYNSSKVVPVNGTDGTLGYKLASTVAASIAGTPKTGNCSSCHQGEHQVDWKKRGEMDPSLDVHANLGCMGCHQRKDITVGASDPAGGTVGVSGNAKEQKLSLCDPAKGGSGPWDNLQNKVDNVAFKSCADCHLSSGDLGAAGQKFSAPNPDSAHTMAGLTATLLQKKDSAAAMDGVANASHLDIISCEACHINKKQKSSLVQDPVTGEWLTVTGGAFVDGSGPDEEMRLATHDTDEVARDMGQPDSFGYNWARDKKIHPGNYLSSFFWRDKNDVDYDANADGKPHGMDAVLPTHVAKLVNFDHTAALFYDGVVTASEIQSHIDNLNTGLFALNGQPAAVSKVFLSWVTVPFTMSHQIAPAAEALGAGGCTDCHGAANGLFNGTINLQGNAKIAWNAAQMTPMTKVNGMSEITFMHPNQKDKFWGRSIASGGLHKGPAKDVDGIAGDDGTNSLKNLTRAQVLYETTFQTRDTSWKTSVTGTNIGQAMPGVGNKASTKGWLLKLEVTNDGGATATPRTAMVKKDITTVDGLVDGTAKSLPANFIDCTNMPFGFCVQATDTDGDLTNDAIQIVADTTNGYAFRIHPASTAGGVEIAGKPAFGYGLKDDLWIAQPWTGTDGNSYAGASEWVGYLNSIGAAPIASITSAGLNIDTDGDLSNDAIEVGSTATLTADNTQAGDFTYTWTCTDAAGSIEGASVQRTFNTPGTFTLRLAVTNNNTGEVTTTTQGVKVVSAPVGAGAMTASYDYPAGAMPKLTVSGIPAAANRLVVIWGDGKRQMVENPGSSVTLGHAFQTFGDNTGTFTTEVRAVDYPNGGLLAKLTATVEKTQLDGGTVPVTDAVTIDSSFVGLVTNVDLVTLTGTRSAGKTVVVSCSDTNGGNLDNPSVGSVWYPGTDSWSVDVQLSEDAPNTCTATVGTANDSVDLTYTPATGGPTAAPTNLNYTVDGYDAVNGTMNVTLTGAFTGNGNTIDVVVNYPVDAAVGTVTYPTTTTFSVPITGLLYIDPNYITVQEVDAAGNDGPDNYYTIQYEATP